MPNPALQYRTSSSRNMDDDDAIFSILCTLTVEQATRTRGVNKRFRGIADQSITYLLSRMTPIGLRLLNESNLTLRPAIHSPYGIGVSCEYRIKHRTRMKHLVGEVIWVDRNVMIGIVDSRVLQFTTWFHRDRTSIRVTKERLQTPTDWPELHVRTYSA